MRTPKSKLQLFVALGALAGKMKTFTETKEVKIESNEIELMRELYPDVQVLGGGAMPLQLNAQCAGCIRDALEVFTSLYNRLAKDPDVNSKAQEILDQEEKDNAPAPVKPKAKTAEEKKADKEYKERVDKLTGLGFIEHEGFLNLTSIGVSIPLLALKTESKESFDANFEKFAADIESLKEDALNKRFDTRVEALKAIGYSLNEDGTSFVKGEDGYIDAHGVRVLDETPFEETLKVLQEDFQSEQTQAENDRLAKIEKDNLAIEKENEFFEENSTKEKEVTPLKEVTDVPKTEETKPKATKKKVTFED